jgi:hypothetical protein
MLRVSWITPCSPPSESGDLSSMISCPSPWPAGSERKVARRPIRPMPASPANPTRKSGRSPHVSTPSSYPWTKTSSICNSETQAAPALSGFTGATHAKALCWQSRSRLARYHSEAVSRRTSRRTHRLIPVSGCFDPSRTHPVMAASCGARWTRDGGHPSDETSPGCTCA